MTAGRWPSRGDLSHSPRIVLACVRRGGLASRCLALLELRPAARRDAAARARRLLIAADGPARGAGAPRSGAAARRQRLGARERGRARASSCCSTLRARWRSRSRARRHARQARRPRPRRRSTRRRSECARLTVLGFGEGAPQPVAAPGEPGLAVRPRERPLLDARRAAHRSRAPPSRPSRSRRRAALGRSSSSPTAASTPRAGGRAEASLKARSAALRVPVHTVATTPRAARPTRASAR